MISFSRTPGRAAWFLRICGCACLWLLVSGSLRAQDTDGDTVLDDTDNCPHIANLGQSDSDGDGFGNACECGATSAVFRANGGRVRFAALSDVDGDSVPDMLLAEPHCQACETDVCPRQTGTATVVSGRAFSRLFELSSSEACDEYGTAMADAGDVDGDNVPDFLIGAEAGAGGHGRAYLYSGATGELLFDAEGAVLRGAEEGGRYGAQVAGVGDFNDDQRADFVIAAPEETVAPLRRGRLYIYLGGGPGEIALERAIPGPNPGEAFGAALDAGMDFDGDNRPDVVVGAPPLGVGPPGHVYVFSLPPDAGVLFEVEGSASEALFGSAVALIGDTNGDGRNGLLVGAPGLPRGATDGEIHVFTGGDPDAEGDAAPHSLGTLSGIAGDGFGSVLAPLDDLDGDGLADFAAGVPEEGDSPGRVRIISGQHLTDLADLRGSGSSSSFGSGLEGTTDVDGDGVRDLVVGDRRVGARASIYSLGDLDGNGLRDVCQACPSVAPITVGLEHVFDLCPLRPEQCFLAQGTPGRSWRVTLVGGGEDVRATLKLRWGAPPGGANADATGRFDESTGARTLLTPVREGDAYLEVKLFGKGACAEDVSLLIEEFDGPVIDMVAPPFVGTGRPITLAVSGLGFTASHQFALVPPAGGETFAGDATVVSEELVEVDFDLSTAPLSAYDLVITEDGEELARAQFAFQVRAFQDSDLLISLRGSPFFRRSDPKGQLTLRYVNTGEEVLPAPLLRIRPVGAGPATQLRLQGQARDQNVSELQLLGVGSDGLPHLLYPGAEEEIPLVFNTGISCDLCTILFEVQVFTPDPRDFIDWSQFPNPDPDHVPDEQWLEVRPPLSVNLGKTWLDYEASLGERARRLRYLGSTGNSVTSLFQFAYSEAAGQPRTAIAGVVLLASSQAPLASVAVGAFVGDVLHSAAETRADGSFVLGGLEPATEYRLEVSEHEVVGPTPGEVTTPAESFSTEGTGDLLGVRLEVAPGGSSFALPAESSDEMLPETPPKLPDDLFSTAAVWGLQVISSRDPNKKTDCVLPGDALFTEEEDDEGGAAGGAEGASLRPIIDYTIFFENSRCALAAARQVRIIDTLDATMFDLSSIQLTEISVGEDSVDKLISLDEPIWNVWNLSRTVENVSVVRLSPLRDLGPECDDGALPECDGSEEEDEGEGEAAGGVGPEIVNVPKVSVDVRLEEVEGEDKYELTWTISTASFGFLPPNDCATHQGEGFVSFRIKPAPGMETAQLENDVEVLFDGDEQRALSLSVTTDLMPTEVPVSPAHPLPVDNPGGDADLLVPADQELSWGPVLADHYLVSVWRMDAGERVTVVEDQRVVGSAFFPENDWELATEYEWEVVAVNAIGPSLPTTWMFVTAGEPEAPPSFVALNGPSDASAVDGDFALEWDTADGASTYSVYVWESDQPRGRPVAHVGSLTDYVPLGLEPGKTYSWQVVATNEGGESESPVWTFTTGASAFRRGDSDSSGEADITDAIHLLNHLFLGGPAPTCASAADVDDSGDLLITDGIALLNFLFGGGDPIPPPFEECGFDTTDDPLTCDFFAPCP